VTAGVLTCGKETRPGGAPCGRTPGHLGRCIDARVIAKYGDCERHDWIGTDCPICTHEQEGT
jgi:hypothetical protein